MTLINCFSTVVHDMPFLNLECSLIICCFTVGIILITHETVDHLKFKCRAWCCLLFHNISCIICLISGRQSRQVQLCNKVPPSNKRSYWGNHFSHCKKVLNFAINWWFLPHCYKLCVFLGNGPGYNVSNSKSNLMKKAKIEFLKRYFLLQVCNFCISNLSSSALASRRQFPCFYLTIKKVPSSTCLP